MSHQRLVDTQISFVSKKLGGNILVMGTVTSLARSDRVQQLPHAHSGALCFLQGLISPSEGAEWDPRDPSPFLWVLSRERRRAASLVCGPGTHTSYFFGFHGE